MTVDHSVRTGEIAADLAAVAALLEIAEEIGVSPLLNRAEPFTVDDVAAATAAPRESCAEFVGALCVAGLIERFDRGESFRSRPDMADRRYESGYLTWAMSANRPYIEHALEFLRDPVTAAQDHDRDGRRVAVFSRWVGSLGFYPLAFDRITELRPARVVDLGAGAGGLLVHLLTTLPDCTGTAIDMSAAACAEARLSAERAGVAERLDVVNRPIESLVHDPSPVRDADVVHAGFVLHDLAGDPDTFVDVLRACRAATAPGCRLIVTDAVPYVPTARERAFSALFTYLHASSMGVQLPTEEQWAGMFRRAGYTDVTCTPHRMPAGRLFVVSD